MVRLQVYQLAWKIDNGAKDFRRDGFALTPQRAANMKPKAIIMHPGPMNRGLEIDAEVADGPRSVILKQAANGVFCRMAALEWCIQASN